MAPGAGPALKLFHEDQDSRAPYTFKLQMRYLGRKIKNYHRGRTNRHHVFTFHNTEALEEAITSREVKELIANLGFQAISTEQKNQGEDARTVFVKKLDDGFFHEYFYEHTIDDCEDMLFGELKRKNDAVENIQIHREPQTNNKTVLPTTMLVTFMTIAKALEWVKEDTELHNGDILAKDKQMHKAIGYGICVVCRRRNCSKNGKQCSGPKLCANCLRPECQFEGCPNTSRCNNCNKKVGHTTGSSRCPKNRDYAFEKRKNEQLKKRDTEMKNGNQEAIAQQLIDIRNLVTKKSDHSSYAAAVSPTSDSPSQEESRLSRNRESRKQEPPKETPARGRRRLFDEVQIPAELDSSPIRNEEVNPATGAVRKYFRGFIVKDEVFGDSPEASAPAAQTSAPTADATANKAGAPATKASVPAKSSQPAELSTPAKKIARKPVTEKSATKNLATEKPASKKPAANKPTSKKPEEKKPEKKHNKKENNKNTSCPC